jgi:hypothetical protein
MSFYRRVDCRLSLGCLHASLGIHPKYYLVMLVLVQYVPGRHSYCLVYLFAGIQISIQVVARVPRQSTCLRPCLQYTLCTVKETRRLLIPLLICTSHDSYGQVHQHGIYILAPLYVKTILNCELA